MDPLIILRDSLRDPAVIVSSMGIGVAALALPLGMIQIYDRIIPNAGYETLAAIAAIVVVAIGVELAFRTIRQSLLERGAARFEVAAYAALTGSLLSEDPASSREHRSGELLTRMTAVDRLRDLHTGPSSTALLDLPLAVAFLMMLAAISPIVVAALLCLVTLSFAVLKRQRGKVLECQAERREVEARRQSFLSEALGQIETVQSLRIAPQIQRRYERLLAHSGRITHQLDRNTFSAKSFAAATGTAAPLLVACLGAYLYTLEGMSLGLLAATVILTGRIVQPIMQFEAFIAHGENVRIAREDLRFLMQRPKKAEGRLPLRRVTRLALEGVATRPDTTTGIAFEGVDACFEKGTITRIEAPTAGHASTFLKLLAGEGGVSAGRVTVDGRDIEDFSMTDRASAIRLLEADNRFLDGTLMENLTNFQPERHTARALALSHRLGLDRQVLGTVDGFDIPVGSSESQRLPRSLLDVAAVVANLVSDPRVILLDAPNSSFDMATDQAFLRMIADRRPDAIMIVHTPRPSLARLADRTLDISGWVAEPRSAEPAADAAPIAA